MRVVREQRLAGCGTRSSQHPIVGTDTFDRSLGQGGSQLIEIDLFGCLSVKRTEIGQCDWRIARIGREQFLYLLLVQSARESKAG